MSVEAEVTAVRVAYFETQPSVNDPDQDVQVRLSAARGDKIELSQREFDRLSELDAVQEPGSHPMPGTGPPVATPFSTPVRDPDTGEESHWTGPVMGDPTPGSAVGGLTPDERAALEARARGEGGDGSDDAAAIEERDYDGASVPALKAEVARRELDVEGTGSGGNVVKSDLVAALEADDENQD